ncbi:hypothetical protein C4588_02095 [Candidatus Parcubacteria bacterium]|nr:MAG: hypothetical protein C4588_02095 [Candidatus Parcubacteria bacterium]
MAIDTFTKQGFEKALPEGFWTYTGLMGGEHTYQIKITEDIFITVRSSVGPNGFSADTGMDSIRCWLVGSEGQPLGNKVQKYITRVSGWEGRLLENLRTLWGWAKWAGYCPECHIPLCIFKSKQPKSKGKIFKKCCQCDKHFKWLEE